ncbi:MAG: methyltransferase domain-containing protein [Sandaracinaceae bacterium]
MSEQRFGESYRGTAPENYQKFFVPMIGAPVADDLVERAGLAPGERVLDVACGTGVVTRLAAEKVGPDGRVAGLDVNAGMLEVARRATPPGLSIDWYEAAAESIPLSDESYDVVLCAMGLQFMTKRLDALREMRRILVEGGRALFELPGPTPRGFELMADTLTRHVGAKAAGFVQIVFSLHDTDDLEQLVTSAGFREVRATAELRRFPLPPPAKLLWGYVSSTPLAAAVASATAEQRAALEGEFCARWTDLPAQAQSSLEVRMTTVEAVK